MDSQRDVPNVKGRQYYHLVVILRTFVSIRENTI